MLGDTITGGHGVRRAAPLAGAAALGLFVAGCGKPPAPPAFPPAEVAVETVRTGRVPEQYEFVGEVVAFRRVEVRTPVSGIITERPFREGAEVRKGDVLFRIDRTLYEAAYRSAEARLRNAERTLARYQPLLADNAIAQVDVDNAQTEVDRARADFDQAKKNLDDATVRAEIAGRVGKAQLELGARVTGPADLLTTIDQLEPVYVSFRPSAQQLLAWKAAPGSRDLIRPGSRLRIQVTLPDGTVLPRTGVLDYVDPVLSSETGTQEFRARFTNADRLLVPGQFVRVKLEGFEAPDAITVPQRAVQQQLGRRFVYVVGTGDTVAMRDVEVGSWTGDRWIVARGLAAGDRVVVDGTQKIGPGRVVKPVAAAAAAASGAPAPAAAGKGAPARD